MIELFVILKELSIIMILENSLHDQVVLVGSYMMTELRRGCSANQTLVQQYLTEITVNNTAELMTITLRDYSVHIYFIFFVEEERRLAKKYSCFFCGK